MNLFPHTNAMVWRLAALLLGFLSQAYGRDFQQEVLPSSLSNVVASENGHCEPRKVRLALTNRASEMRVSWNTQASRCHGKVHYGQAGLGSWSNTSVDKEFLPDLPEFEFVAELVDSDSYGPGDFCGEPASKDDFQPPNLHTTVLTGLEYGKWYQYRIGHHHPVRSFKAAPGPDASSEFTFIAYGDMGESVHRAAKSPGAAVTARRVAQEVLEGGAELVVHVGDISYADGEHKIWDAFLEQIEPYSSRAPYQIVVGNHEYDWKTGKEKHRHHKHAQDASGNEEPYQPEWGNFGNDSGGECGVTVSKLFPMPGSALGGPTSGLPNFDNHARHPNPPFWFSFDYGSIHFAAISTEHDLTSSSHQHKWLERDLASVDRCTTPWVVLLSHRPWYVVHPHKSNRVVGDHLRASLEHLLERHEVDLVLSGHIHAMARTCNVYKERCIDNDNGGTTHITLGCGGRRLSDVKHIQPDWLEYAERAYGFGRVRVKGSRHLTFEYVHSETGKVHDSVTLTTSRSAMRGCNAIGNHGVGVSTLQTSMTALDATLNSFAGDEFKSDSADEALSGLVEAWSSNLRHGLNALMELAIVTLSKSLQWAW